jgi:two-component system KDP operon response regulator KdpE
MLENKVILIVEDDHLTQQALSLALRREEATVKNATTGKDGLLQFFENHPNLVILDLSLPDMDGWYVLSQFHRIPEVPVIIMTAVADEDTVVRGLEMGAVDFITKPFSPKILLARIRVALRLSSPVESLEDQLRYEDDCLTIDPSLRHVSIEGKAIKMTKTEYKLLAALLRRKGQVATFPEILTEVWGIGYEDSVDYVHVYMSRLRRKLEAQPRSPKYLVTVHGEGYRFNPVNVKQ